MNSKVLVTVAIGGYHRLMWEKIFAESWRRYAERHGYDIIVIDDYIDKDPAHRGFRTPHWQKCLILEDERVKRYDWAVWLDTDILINYNTAPCIVSQVQGDAIGGVLYGDHLNTSARARAVRLERHRSLCDYLGNADHFGLGREPTAPERYILSGVEPQSDFINTGVLVLQPKKHTSFMRDVYDGATHNDINNGEMMRLSGQLLKYGIFQAIDIRFNADYSSECLESYPYLLLPRFQEDNKTNRMLHILAATVIWNNNYFIHCVGDTMFSRADVMWIFKDAPEWQNYEIEFKD